MPFIPFSWQHFLVITLSLSSSKIYGVQKPKQNNDACISKMEAAVELDRSHKSINLNVKWLISQKGGKNLSGFHLSFITGNGRSLSWEFSKETRHYSLSIPLKLLDLEHYTFTVECISKRQSSAPKSAAIEPKDICRVLRKNDVQSPYQCLTQLENLHVYKCKQKKIIISWKRPNVTGCGKYIIRHSLVDCGDHACCSNTKFKDEFKLSKDRNNFSYTNVAENSQHCFEILMCPNKRDDDFNCEIKQAPFLVDCRRKVIKKQFKYLLIFGITAVVTVILGLILICHRKRRKTKEKELQANLLTEVKDVQLDFVKTEVKEKTTQKAPMLLIIFCAGCHAVEDFVINFIHILRLNGVDAVSEITEEEKVQKFGRGVYLNDRLKDADFVMVLCTEEYSTQSRALRQNLYFYALNVIQNRVIEQGGDLSHYIMVHLNQPSFIPETLRPASIDFGAEIHDVLQCLFRRVFAVDSFQMDKNGPKKNEMSLESQSGDNVEVLSKFRDKITAAKHPRCSRESCIKGKKSPGKRTEKIV